MNGPQTTVANPAWFRAGDVNRPRVERARLHRRLLEDARAAAAGVATDRRAVVVTGPDVAGRRSAIEEVLGAAVTRYLPVGADHFASQLLAATEGSEPGIDAVSEEANALAERLRDAALRDGVNVVVDTNFSDPDQAVTVGRQLAEAGYRIDVVDIQPGAPSDLPPAVRTAPKQLAAEVGAVTTYRRFVVGGAGSLTLDADLARATIGGPLVDATAARAAVTARAATSGSVPRRVTDHGRGD